MKYLDISELKYFKIFPEFDSFRKEKQEIVNNENFTG